MGIELAEDEVDTVVKVSVSFEEKEAGDMRWALFQFVLASVDKEKLAQYLSVYKQEKLEKVMPLLHESLSEDVLRKVFPYFYEFGMIKVDSFLDEAETVVSDLLTAK